MASAKLTIGMACFDDFDGVWFSIQAARLFHPEVMAETEFLVVDNNPESAHGKAIAETRASWWSDQVTYVPFVARRGTAVRDEIFRRARGEVVLSIDCHVLIWPGALTRLLKWLDDRPDCLDLLQGPMALDDLRTVQTHMAPEWRSEMFGTWAADPRGQSIDAEAFEIPMHGLGLFGCRRKAWLGFSPLFRGFGAEEGYIHEKYRQAGRRTWCLPFLRWVHRFKRPAGVKYPLRLDDKIHNYLAGHAELGLSPGPIFQHFARRQPLEKMAQTWREVQAKVAEMNRPEVTTKARRVFGVWYTNNAAPEIVLHKSLESIQKAADVSTTPVEVWASVWEPIPGNPFREVQANFRLGVHLGIAMQILQVLYDRQAAGEPPAFVAFLEHDVLYPPGYFDQATAAIEAAPDKLGVWNDNFIGLRRGGWCEKSQTDLPTHQLVMRFDAAIAHLEQVVRECIQRRARCIEPDDKSRFARVAFEGPPAVHVNHERHFTSHPNIYAADPFCQVHPFWGEAADFYPP